MSYLYYVLPAVITFLIALYAFFKDAAAVKTSVLNWTFVIVTGLLWPITLPFIISSKLRAASLRKRAALRRMGQALTPEDSSVMSGLNPTPIASDS